MKNGERAVDRINKREHEILITIFTAPNVKDFSFPRGKALMNRNEVSPPLLETVPKFV